MGQLVLSRLVSVRIIKLSMAVMIRLLLIMLLTNSAQELSVTHPMSRIPLYKKLLGNKHK
ncbi:hypothetical protein AN946_00455 [Trueperella pyogenes]|nr:hypothetical protein AN946_00455 [Trueperella pyogenes]